jgi:lipocalin-like protein
MNRRNVLELTTTVLLCAGVVFSTSHAPAQQKSLKEQLTGVWTLVSIDNVLPDGKKQQLWGANPKGILILDAGGRFSQTQVRADRAKLKSANRLEATAEESKLLMHASLAQFGTWSVSEPDKTLIMRVEGALLPNAEGTDSKRIVTSITAAEVKFTNPGPATGGKNEVVYRRAK